jgi:hypothetical protein
MPKAMNPLSMCSWNGTSILSIPLRYFENKSSAEIGGALQISASTAQKRLTRAVERLRLFFIKRGTAHSSGMIAGAISTHAVQVAPIGLTKTISAVSLGKGVVVSSSTLSLAKGVLKLMIWTKTKIAVVSSVAVIFVVGTATVTFKEIQEHPTYPWQVPKFNYLPVDAPTLLGKTSPQVRIVRSRYSYWVEGTPFTQGDGESLVNGKVIVHTNQSKRIGIGVTADAIVKTAYGSDSLRTIYTTKLPEGRYDFIANLPHDSLKVLQDELKKKLGVVGKWVTVETNVLVLKLANPNTQAFKPAKGFGNSLNTLRMSLENIIGGGLPVIDQTGLTNRYDVSFSWPKVNTSSEAGKQAIKDALYEQLGLVMVPSREPIEMLVVEQAK